MDHSVLQPALKHWHKNQSIVKVLNIETEPAVEENQNFLSTVKRLKLRVVLGNGRVTKRSAILKDSQLEGDNFRQFVKSNCVFEVETKMYTTTLKEIEYLMEEFGDTDSILWSRLLHYEPYSSLLFEDLQVSGFKSLLIPCYLNLEHAILVLKNLGKYHGMCKVLEERGIIDRNGYPKWFVLSNKKIYQIWHIFLQQLASIIKDNWDVSWVPITERLGNIALSTVENKLEYVKYLVQEKSIFKVLNHGDCKISNIMFKYDWRNVPIEMRFLDFQLPTYGSPCIDLSYFLYRAIHPTMRRHNFNQLLQCYHESLISTMERFRYTGSKPHFEDIRDEMDKISLLSLFLCLVNYIPIRTSEELIDTENSSASKTIKQKVNNYKNQRLTLEYVEDIKEFVNKCVP